MVTTGWPQSSAAGVSFEMQDNACLEIGNWRKAHRIYPTASQ